MGAALLKTLGVADDVFPSPATNAFVCETLKKLTGSEAEAFADGIDKDGTATMQTFLTLLLKKASLELLYGKLGMTLTDAVKVFFEKSLNVGGIPFDLRIENYNRDTLEALRETLDIETGRIQAKRYHSVDELFAANDAEIAAEEAVDA